jgi:hypothetical protein
MSLYLQHVSCLDMFRCICHVHLYFMSPTFWYWWHLCIHITLTALELFLLHKEFNHCTLANKCHWKQHFLQHTAETLIKRHMHKTCIHTNFLIAHITGHVRLHMALMCITELWLWLCITFITTWTLLILAYLHTTRARTEWWLECKAWTVVWSAKW